MTVSITVRQAISLFPKANSLQSVRELASLLKVPSPLSLAHLLNVAGAKRAKMIYELRDFSQIIQIQRASSVDIVSAFKQAGHPTLEQISNFRIRLNTLGFDLAYTSPDRSKAVITGNVQKLIDTKLVGIAADYHFSQSDIDNIQQGGATVIAVVGGALALSGGLPLLVLAGEYIALEGTAYGAGYTVGMGTRPWWDSIFLEWSSQPSSTYFVIGDRTMIPDDIFEGLPAVDPPEPPPEPLPPLPPPEPPIGPPPPPPEPPFGPPPPPF